MQRYTDEDFEFLVDQTNHLKERMVRLEGNDQEEDTVYTKPPLQKIMDPRGQIS